MQEMFMFERIILGWSGFTTIVPDLNHSVLRVSLASSVTALNNAANEALIIHHELWRLFAGFLFPEPANTQKGPLDQLVEIWTDVLPDWLSDGLLPQNVSEGFKVIKSSCFSRFHGCSEINSSRSMTSSSYISFELVHILLLYAVVTLKDR